jgi:uncharacterized protein YgiM (DUF1202 family)
MNKKTKIALLVGVPVLVGIYLIYKQLKGDFASGSDTNPVPPTPVPPTPTTCSNPAKVSTHSGTRLRASASTSSTIKKTYLAGVTLQVIGQQTASDGLWYNVKEGSNEGWMRSDVVTTIC